jgi:methylenetetrahydrofolate dehydrogenase (NADP+)/methenyltetrahydrofolate cyclohydrolase
MKLIDGKAIAQKIKDDIKKKVSSMKTKPGLAVVLVGENPASKVYVNMKEVACSEVGFYSEKYKLDEKVSEAELLELVNKLNKNDKIHGILVQLPLPKHINEAKVLETISPKKDVDGFHPVNMGNLLIGTNHLVPCTPKGALKLIESTGEKIEGKHAVVIGRSNIVGKPIAQLLLQKNATVTICHSKTKNLPEVCSQADIIVAAIGRPKMITKDYVKKGVIVIDVGINRIEDKTKPKGYYLCGDVDFDNVKDKCSFITPVPGGVGPMTIAMLMRNTLIAAKKQQGYSLANEDRL